MTTYSTLLTTKRFKASKINRRTIITEAESDRGRVLFCPAFRRLQQKAQVFSMEPNAAVRSRLTHSLEVAQMGRYISDQITPKLRSKKLATNTECTALVSFVETACLMHDIGNPPFGHFGEAAIAEWFQKNGEKAIIESSSNSLKLESANAKVTESLADFLNFDGNPQGLRIALKLQRKSDRHGLNLTKTTIASYLKYVRTSNQVANEITSPFTKKCGYFSSEKDIIANVWSHFGYNLPQRFPLAYIMEAADDIAYCISDLEDSIEKNLLNEKIALSEIYTQWLDLEFDSNENTANEIKIILKYASNGIDNKGEQFTYTDFRTKLNVLLTGFAANQYINFHTQVLDGSLPTLLPETSPAGKILDILKAYCRSKVYRHEVVQKVELAGYTAIYGLLDKFKCLLTCDSDRFNCALNYSTKDNQGKPIIVENKLLSLFPKNYIKTYHDDLSDIPRNDHDYFYKEWNLRAHLITDFISGMTDDFATTTYQTLSGMKL